MKNKFLAVLLLCCLLCPLALAACTKVGAPTFTSGSEPTESSGEVTSSEPTPDNSTSETNSGTNPSGTSSSKPDSGTSEPDPSANALAWAFGQPKNGTLPEESVGKVVNDTAANGGIGITKYETISSKNYHFINAFATSTYSLGGITNPNNNSSQYYRLDYANRSQYPTTSGNIQGKLAYHTAGVTLRFVTDADTIAIKATMQYAGSMNHFPNKGAYGFDVYVGTGTNRTWVTTTANQLTNASSLNEVITLPKGWKEVMICFPQYGGVSLMQVGFPSGAKLCPPTARTGGTIAFYGTSITQGACSSRAGTSFTNILGRALDADVRNLGFSGSAFGEQSIAQYIAGLTGLSAIVLDFERNHGSDSEALKAVYEPFYQTIRAAHPNIPIIFVTRPIFTATPTKTDTTMRNIVKSTYDKALARGENVYFVDGLTYFTDGLADIYTVDGTHPNDSGHFFMASKIYPVLAEAMGK